MKKIFKYIIVIFLLLFIPVTLLYVPIGNNIILKIHTNELKHFKLNATYEVLAADKECGKLVGNGNGMQKEISNTKNYYVLYSFKNAPFDSIWNNDLRAH